MTPLTPAGGCRVEPPILGSADDLSSASGSYLDPVAVAVRNFRRQRELYRVTAMTRRVAR